MRLLRSAQAALRRSPKRSRLIVSFSTRAIHALVVVSLVAPAPLSGVRLSPREDPGFGSTAPGDQWDSTGAGFASQDPVANVASDQLLLQITESPTPTPIETPTPSLTATDTPSPSLTPTPTSSASETPSPPATPTETPTLPETATETPTPSETPTETASPTPTELTAQVEPAVLLHLEVAGGEVIPGEIVSLQWRIEGWDLIKETPLLELVLHVPVDFEAVEMASGEMDLATMALRTTPTSADGATTWSVAARSAPPYRVVGEVWAGDRLISSAAMILGAPGRLPPSTSYDDLLLIPIGWSGEASGTWGYEWSGMSGRVWWDAYPGGPGELRTQAHLDFSYLNVADGTSIEVCSRGDLPMQVGPTESLPAPVRVAPSRSAQSSVGDEGWTCIEDNLDLSDPSIPVRIGHFPDANAGRPQSASSPSPSSAVPDRYSWQVWVRSIGGVETLPPPTSSTGWKPLASAAQSGSAGGIVYLATRGNVARSRDFYTSPSPHWEDARGALPVPIQPWGGIIEFALDPFDTKNRAWVVLGAGAGAAVWRTGNLDAATPTWTEVLTQAQISAALGGESAMGKRILASNEQPGLIFVAVRGDTTGTLAIGRSGDYGSTWLWKTNLGILGDRVPGMELSDQEVSRLWTSVRQNGRILYSTDGGQTFGLLKDFGTWWNPYDVHAPTWANGSDQVLFTAVDYPTNTELLRSVDGGSVWSVVTFPANYPAKLNRTVGTYVGDRQQAFYTRWACGGWAFHRSSDGGATWTVRYTTSNGFSSAWMWPSDSSRLLTARDGGNSGPLQTLNAIYSSDGGFTWQDKTGDWPTTIGAYYGQPGTCGGAGAVTILDTQSGLPKVSDFSSQSFCSPSSGFRDENECVNNRQSGTQGKGGHPINTRTGGFDYPVADLTIPTSAGDLLFQRSYSSQATTTYTTYLGFGWTHNHAIELIFPGDPGGIVGRVLFKAHSANIYEFVDNGDGTYSPAAGLGSSLTLNPGPPVTYTVADDLQNVYNFDEFGTLLSLADPQGHTWTYSYDVNGRLDRVTDDTGLRFLDLTYDGQGRVQSVADNTGRDAGFGYDAAGDLTTYTDVLDQTWTYEYDPSHRLTRVLDPRSVTVIRTEYDAQGRAFRQFNGESELLVEITYNADGTATLTDALGNQETHTYDERGTLSIEMDDLGAASNSLYDGNFRPALITDENGNDTQLIWSGAGTNLETIIDAENNLVDLNYDALNNLTQVIDARNNTTNYGYDGTLLTQVTDALQGVTIYNYTTAADAPQPIGLLKEIVDPLNHVTRFTYDSFGQRLTMTDALNHTTTYTYDGLGRLRTTRDPLGRTAWTCYDAAGRVVRTVANASGDGGTPQTDPCNAASYVPSSDPAVDRITTTVFDEAGNFIGNTGPDGVITRTYYDLSSRPTVLVQNLTGQTIQNPTPPTFDPAFPDRNIRSETVYDDTGNAIASIDNAGVITRTYFDVLSRSQFVVQNLVGQAISVGTPPVFDPAFPDSNVRTEYVYDPVGSVIAAIDNTNVITRTYYDANNRPEFVVQNLVGQAISIATPPVYNPAFPDGNVLTQTVYDPSGNAIAMVDTLGVITRTYFDVLNRPFAVVQNLVGQPISTETPPSFNPAFPDRNIRTDYVYDVAGNQIAVTDTNGVITRSYYDAVNRSEYIVQNLVGQAISVGTPPTYNPAFPDRNVRTQTVYDDAGNAIATIDTHGVITRTYLDGLNRIRYTVQNLTGQPISDPTPPAFNPAFPDQNVRTEALYDAASDGIAVIDNGGVIARTYFDDLHRSTSVVQNLVGQAISVETPPARNPATPDENVRTDTVYGTAGLPIRSVDPNSHTTEICYDGVYRVVKTVQNPSVSSPCGAYTPSANPDEDIITAMTYDRADDQVMVVDPNGKASDFLYDALHRLTGTRDPLDLLTAYGYDGLGNRTSMTDAAGVVTRYEYDALSRLTAVVENYISGGPVDQETNVRTEYTYDGLGNRRTIRDARTNVTTFHYDALSRLIRETDPLLNATEYGYDGVGNRVSLKDAEAATTFFSYDDLNRLTGIDYPAPEADVTFTYNAAGDWVGMTDGVGPTAWTFDDVHRPLTVTDPFAGVVQYTYDLTGNRTQLVYPDARTVNYAYDLADRMEQVTDWDTLLTTYSFDRGGRLSGVTLPNGVVSTYTYDGASRLLSLTHADGPATLSSFGYTYDNAGNRLTATESGRQPLAVFTPDGIFADGFESGTLGGWTASNTGNGTLTVTTAAALAGTYGMQALISSTKARYVEDGAPNAETRYRARFYFDPNTLAMANNNAHYIFQGFTGSSTVVLRLEFTFTTADGYRLRVEALNNATSWISSAWVNISDAPHNIELDWKSAASGSVAWWLDGVAQAGVSGFDNSSRRIDMVRLGPAVGLDSGTSGTEFFDAFESRRQSFIGAGTALPETIFTDDFESGSFGYWTANTGVSVTTNSSLAPVGTKGMSVTLSGATTAKYVTNDVPTAETRYRARFYFDPNMTTMANGADHVMLYGFTGTSTQVLELDLGYTTAGGYRLRARLRGNSTTWNDSPWVNISDAPHMIEVDWQSGTSGSLAWWIDEVVQPAPATIDNSARRIDRVQLGAVAAVDQTTVGTLFFDAFESRRSTYIGPMTGQLAVRSITYDYDPLYRLTAADYDDGTFFHYTYDPVGNRLTEVTQLGTSNYVYDIANRLTFVGGVTYTWDPRGNLLNDGVSTYTYDRANRLVTAAQGGTTYTFAYNGLGDRLRQTVNGAPTNYSLDREGGLTQVLAAGGPDAYLYGPDLATGQRYRIGEEQPGGWEYHLPDALMSSRQLVDAAVDVDLAESYQPFGATLASAGTGASIFQFAGEQRDGTGLTFLRARYLSSAVGRFVTADMLQRDVNRPMSYNLWQYANSNPINLTDPSGHDPWWCDSRPDPDRCRRDYFTKWSTYERFDRTLPYIHQEMVRNSRSEVVRTIRLWIDLACLQPQSAGSYFLAALSLWFRMERPHGDWDHKPELERMLELRGDPSTPRDDDFSFPIRGDRSHEYYYDIWSNMHYGYVGSAAGFTDVTLQVGAAIVELAGRFDPSDVVSIQIGIDLWSAYGNALLPIYVHQSVLANTQRYLAIAGQETVINWTNGR